MSLSNRTRVKGRVYVYIYAGRQEKGYPYRHDLVILDSRRPRNARSDIPGAYRQIRTPVRVEAWERCLASHPDRILVEYILKGFREGFRIGFAHER